MQGVGCQSVSELYVHKISPYCCARYYTSLELFPWKAAKTYSEKDLMTMTLGDFLKLGFLKP